MFVIRCGELRPCLYTNGLAVFVRWLTQPMGVMYALEPKSSLCEETRPTEESDHSLELIEAMSLSKQL